MMSTAVPVISVSLDQISGSRTRTRSYHRTSTAAGQRTNNSPRNAADERSFASAVMRTVKASLSTDAQTSKRS
jgi:ribosomal protein L13